MNSTADLETIRLALFTGQKSATKAAAQEAFLRIEKLITSAPDTGTVSLQEIDEIQNALESIPTNLQEDRRNGRAINALRSAHVVGVLDAWSVQGRRNVPHVQRQLSGAGWSVMVSGAERDHFFEGPTPAAARAAAAEAIKAEEAS